jgi:hypothetical protein
LSENKPRWHFIKKRPSAMGRDPISSEFFADESVEGAARSVIREAIQNSLDARDKKSGKPIEIRIALGIGAGAVKAPDASPYFSDVWEHLAAPKCGLLHAPRVVEPCAFLTVEDFGTSGLEGDPKSWSAKEGKTNSFYTFFRAEALSDKSGDDRGRWGVGKLVFPRASRGSAFFGLTVQRSTLDTMLMGRMVLKHHTVAGVEFQPDAFFGAKEPVDDDADFVMPCRDAAYIDRFRKLFGVTRTNEPGLSVVVPWLYQESDDEFSAASLTRAIAAEYLLPILRGKLVATVSASGQTTRLDRAALMRNDQHWVDGPLELLLRLGQFASTVKTEEVLVTKPAEQSGAPKWPDEAIAEEMAQEGRSRLEAGLPIAVDVPITVYQRGHPPAPSRLRVHLATNGTAARQAPAFVREDITVSNAKGPWIPGYASLVTIDDGPLATLLGDSENPAHTEWRQTTRGFKEKYQFGKSFLDFAKQAPMNVYKALFDGPREDDIFALGSFFPDLAVADGEKGGGPSRKKRKGGPVDPPPDIPARARRYSVSKTDGGFEVRRGDPTTKRPGRLRIQAAYDVRGGNPLKKYAAFDFDFSKPPIVLDADGALIEVASENEALVEVISDDFSIRVTGFDENRDVFTRVTVEDDDGN